MTDTFRALCAELVDNIHRGSSGMLGWTSEQEDELLARARSALAQPEPEEPKNCWLDDEPGLYPSPCVFDDPGECIDDCKHATQLSAAGEPKTDCKYYRQSVPPEPEPEALTDRELEEEFGSVLLKLPGNSLNATAVAFARAVLARWGNHPGSPDSSGNPKAELTGSPADGEVAELAAFLRGCADEHGLPRELTRAADLLERLACFEQALSAVMPLDFKDWWQNSKDEWPDVAAGVITNLREREQLAWDRVEGVR